MIGDTVQGNITICERYGHKGALTRLKTFKDATLEHIAPGMCVLRPIRGKPSLRRFSGGSGSSLRNIPQYIFDSIEIWKSEDQAERDRLRANFDLAKQRHILQREHVANFCDDETPF